MEGKIVEEDMLYHKNSDASTFEEENLSDDDSPEFRAKCGEIDPGSFFSLFRVISEEQIVFYEDLNTKLNKIYGELLEKIDPACVRDKSSALPRCIKLNQVTSSLMNKRRSLFLKRN